MPKILVLGGGYASLSFLKKVDTTILQNDVSITLISNTIFHYKSILLHDVISHRADITIPYFEILPKFVNFICDEVIEIKNDIVITKKAIYEYDILIVGLGFTSNDFGIEGVKEYTYSMVNYDNCLKINDLINCHSNNYSEFAVCGAGLSGIELVSNLAYKFKDSKNIKLKCIDIMPTILPMFDTKSAIYAKKYLENLGVKFYLESKILRIKKDCIIIETNNKQEIIKSDLTLWSAGLKGNNVIERSKIFDSKYSRVEVDNYLNPINCNNKNIFVIGDCSLLRDDKNANFHYASAQLAIKEGEYLAYAITSLINKQPLIKKFYYKSQGMVCSLGKNNAIGIVGNKVIKGRFASIMKKLIELKWEFKLKGIRILTN